MTIFAEEPLDESDGAFGRFDDWRTPEAVSERLLRQAEAKSKRPRETRFGRISFGELRERKARAPDYVIDDWMVAREQSMLAGESQSGKSFLAIHAALCISAGLPVFGRRVSPGLVIYQAGESGSGVLDLRIPAWIQNSTNHDLPDRMPFEILPVRVDLWANEDTKKAFLDTIRSIAAEWAPIPLRAVIIDTVSTATPGANENDGRDMSKYLSFGNALCIETGAHVMHVHHFPKGGKTLRGHGSLKADVDTVALVSLDEQTKVRTLTFDKVKDGERGGRLQFELMQVKLGAREDDGKPITSCVVLPVGEKAAQRAEVANSVRLSTIEAGLFQAMWKAVQQFGMVPHADLDCSPTVRVAPYDEVRRLFTESSPMQDAEVFEDDQAREDASRRHIERLRKQMQRACGDLVKKWKVIGLGVAPDPDTGKSTHYAWWTGRPVRGEPQTYPPKQRGRGDTAADAVLAGEGTDWAADLMG